jgi:class 3 adenylate cyclase
MQSIAHWLNTIGLGQYAQRFADNDIDASILRDLTDDDLEKIGVSLGHRKRMLRAIVELDEAACAPEPPHRNEAKRRQLTVMFADLVGSTVMSTRLDPEDLREVIGAYHRCVGEQIVRSGGFVARYMGDGVLAYFGYPQAHEDDAEQAVRAALALVEAVAKLDAGQATSLHVRVGIATGLVVVGDFIGEGPGHENEVVGETPNLAARLQALAEADSVVISSGTHCLLGGLFEFRDLGIVSVKGFSNPLQVWQVSRASTVDSRFEALRATTTPLVGREEEIDLMMHRWWHAAHREGRVVLLSGEPGIGKSRLTVELLERLQVKSSTRLRYFCLPHHQDSALYPIISQFERAAGFRRDDTDEQRLNKLEAILARSSNTLMEAAPLIADLLSVPTGSRYPPLDLTPQKHKEKTLRALLAQLEGLAAHQPMVMVFEDLHWIDPTSLELLDLIVDRVPTMQVLLIITFRPEFAPPWIGRAHVTLLMLNRLPPVQRAEMIAAVTGGKALPQEIVDQIVDRTDGVPLFIEELTKMVMESGLAEANDRYAVTGPVAPLPIPMTLQASLLARLDRLPATREVAQIGAALGRSFSHELISAVAQMPQQQVDDALAQLVSAELIFRWGLPPDAEYAFKHALVQDVAYGTLLRTPRQFLHARITQTLEEQFPDTAAADPALLAHHCAEAGSIGKAIGYRRKAGQQAIAHSAVTEAEAQLRKGLSLLASLPEDRERRHHELRLQIALGVTLFGTRGGDAISAGEAFDRARELCAGQDQADELPTIITCQFINRLYRAQLRSAYQLSGELLNLGKIWNDGAPSPARRWTSKTITSVAYFLRGQSRLWLGNITAARADSEEALRLFDPALLPGQWMIDVQSVLLSVCMGSLTYLGYLDRARVRRDEALARARQVNRAATSVVILARVAGCEAHTETNPVILLDHFSKLEAFCTQHGLFSDYEKFAKWHRACYLIALGRSAEATELLAEAGAELRTARSFLYKPTWHMSLAEALGQAGRPKEGLKELEEAAHQIEATEERWAESNVHCIRGELLIAVGDLAGAEVSLRQAIEIARRQSTKLWELRAATRLAQLWHDQGGRQQAYDLLAQIYNWFTEGFDTPVLKEAKARLDKLA